MAYFEYILKAANVYDYPMTQNETVYAWALRVGRRFAFLNETVYMPELARIFSAASYGESEITEDDFSRMKECYLEMLDMLKNNRLFKVQYVFYKYILNII